MSRAHEAFFIERLARLDRLIAESEALASRSGDEETLLRISEDIARWRETRDGCEYALRTNKIGQSICVGGTHHVLHKFCHAGLGCRFPAVRPNPLCGSYPRFVAPIWVSRSVYHRARGS